MNMWRRHSCPMSISLWGGPPCPRPAVWPAMWNSLKCGKPDEGVRRGSGDPPHNCCPGVGKLNEIVHSCRSGGQAPARVPARQTKSLRHAITLLCLTLAAQTPDTATIRGHVVDQTHAGIPAVRVTAKNTLTGLERTAQTDASGSFSIAGVPIGGAYDVSAAKEGVAEARLSNTTLVGGTTANVDLQLNVAGAQTQVSVTGVVGEVRTDSPQL